MTRPVLLIAVLCSLAAVVEVQSSPASTHSYERCARKGSVTLISTKLVRIYRDRRSANNALVYACHRPTGRATQLGAVLPQGLYQYGGTPTTAVRGTTVAYGLKVDPEGDEGSPGYSIVIVKLPFSGHAFEDAPQFAALQTVPFDPSADDTLAVEHLVIAPNHTIAYTSCKDFNSEPDRCVRPLQHARVVAVPYDSAQRRYKPAIVLDQGNGIDPRSLRLSPSGARIAWNDTGQKHSVTTP